MLHFHLDPLAQMNWTLYQKGLQQNLRIQYQKISNRLSIFFLLQNINENTILFLQFCFYFIDSLVLSMILDYWNPTLFWSIKAHTWSICNSWEKSVRIEMTCITPPIEFIFLYQFNWYNQYSSSRYGYTRCKAQVWDKEEH